jgi:hypothetical protein
MSADRDQIGEMSGEDRDRISRLPAKISKAVGGDVVWDAESYLDVWITEHRMRSERQATARLTWATYVLAGSTFVLVLATIALVVATTVHHG